MKKTLLLALSLLALAFSQKAGAQVVNGYGFSVSQGAYEPITDGTVIAQGADAVTGNASVVCFFKDGVATAKKDDFQGIPLGFSFLYGEKKITSFGVSPSGYLVFRGDEAFTFDPKNRHYIYTMEDECLNDVAGLALPYNMFGADSKISYKVEGTDGNHQLIVQFENILASGSAWSFMDEGKITFQYTISEADNSIKLVFYGWNSFKKGVENTNARLALRGGFEEGVAVVTDYEEGGTFKTDWGKAQGVVGYNDVPTITYGYNVGIKNGLTYTFTYPTEVSAPQAQPTDLILSVTPTTLKYTFNTSATADNYLIVYSEGAELTEMPKDGVTYAQGDKLGNGTVARFGIYDAENEGYRIVRDLKPSTIYNFYVFAVNANGIGGPKYLTASPLMANVATTPEMPADLTLSSEIFKNSVSGSCLSNANDDYVLVVYSQKLVHDFPYTSTADFGTPKGAYKVGDTVEEGHDGKVAYIGKAGNFDITSLPANSPIFVAVFTLDKNGTYSDEHIMRATSTECSLPYTPVYEDITPYIELPAGWVGEGEEFSSDWTNKTDPWSLTLFQAVVNGTPSEVAKVALRLPKLNIDKQNAVFSFDWCFSIRQGWMGNNPYAFTGDEDYLEIQASEDLQSWTTLARIDKTNAPVVESATTYTPFSASLNDFYGKSVYVRAFFSNSQSNTTVKFQNVKVDIADAPVVTVENIKHNTADVKWSYDTQKVEVEIVNGDNTFMYSTTENPIKLTDLSPLTEYTVRVRALSETLDPTSDWSAPVTFTTTDLPALEKPTNLTSEVNGDEAKLSWDAEGEDIASYTVRYRQSDVTEWTLVENITEKTLTLTGLALNCTYYWQVMAKASDGRESAYATRKSFETGSTTAISSVTTAAGSAEYFTTGGSKTANARGIVIKRQGATVKKVVK